MRVEIQAKSEIYSSTLMLAVDEYYYGTDKPAKGLRNRRWQPLEEARLLTYRKENK
jgi:hypothetical protein